MNRQAVLRAVTKCAIATVMCFGGTGSAWAYYIGPSYLMIEGVPGSASDPDHEGWVRVEANYWTERPELREIRGITGKYDGLRFTGPRVPASGPSMLAVSVDKNSKDLPALMALCRKGASLPEITVAESSELARHPQERGTRPADVPEYYRYKLRGVRLTCPVAQGAPEQAFGLHFDTIDWLNYTPEKEPRVISVEPARLPPAQMTGESRAFVVTWFAPVADSRKDQCAAMNTKPEQSDYFALMPPERAAEQRAKLAKQGGADTRMLPYRGPDEMNVTMLPGIVPDPGFATPQVDVVRGFNLDNNDGSQSWPAGTRPHKNFASPDGRTGIDNQLFTILGCIEGWHRDGFLPMISNELRRAGGLSILVDISGIDDRLNDDNVTVSILYSADPMRRDGSSKTVLSDFTFRVNDSPAFSQDFARFRARIVDGVIMTDPLEKIYMHEGSGNSWPLSNARMRLEITPDGNLKALIGGYRHIRQYLATAFFRSSDYENTIGFNSPGMYNAVKRAADGLQDPVTGEFTGISAAYEMEGIPAFIPPEQQRDLLKGRDIRKTTARADIPKARGQ
ncbi:MAG: hypothetical protein KDE55_01060 [Novosphingobium sp.]|nr:hypothetical protein [Novosphingobium sp.]